MTINPLDFDLGDDLTITKPTPRQNAGGTWVSGSLHGHTFQALVFAEHAVNADWELGDSRISKLWIRRQCDRVVVFNWDRGLDVAATTDLTQEIVNFLSAGLADFVFAK